MEKKYSTFIEYSKIFSGGHQLALLLDNQLVGLKVQDRLNHQHRSWIIDQWFLWMICQNYLFHLTVSVNC